MDPVNPQSDQPNPGQPTPPSPTSSGQPGYSSTAPGVAGLPGQTFRPNSPAVPASTPAPASPAGGPIVTGGQPGGTPNVAPGTPGSFSIPAQPVSSGASGPILPPVVTGGPGAAAPQPAPKKRRFSKRLIVTLVALIVVIGGASAFYFGYYTNPSVIYRQSLANTGKGYDKLIDYIDKTSQSPPKGYVGSGSYKFKLDDGTSSDGRMTLKSVGANRGEKNTSGEFTMDVGVGGNRVKGTVRTIKSDGNFPDIYFKAEDLKGLGTMANNPQLETALTKLDNTWIFVDHTLLDSASTSFAGTSEPSDIKPPSREQILDEARAFGEVSQDYVFSTKADKAVIKVVKTHGKEKIAGHTTYHYTVAPQKENIKKYVTAQGEALKKSKLYDWIKENNYQDQVDDAIKEMRQSADDIKASDTFDIWMNADKRIIYKVRLAGNKNPAKYFVDLGLDYKGGDSYPIFLSGQSKDGSTTIFNFTSTINTKTNGVDFKLGVSNDGKTDGGSLTANFGYKPTNQTITISKPAGAKPLAEALKDAGLTDYANELNSLTNGGAQQRAKDAQRQNSIRIIQAQLETYYSDKGYYPTLAEINDPAWRKANMPDLEASSLADPEGTVKNLASTPSAKVYAYQPKTTAKAQCLVAAQCQAYTLTATLSDGTAYVRESLN